LRRWLGIPDLHLVIAGTHAGNRSRGPALLAAAQARGVGARVRVLPRLERTDLRELYTRASALVSASEFEGFGIPILEAMAVGCPVACSPAEAVVEVLGGYGWVATDFSAEALERALRTALAVRQVEPTVLRQAMNRARSTYTWAASAAKVEAILAPADSKRR
jgi:glycosyltransferase involved in cell wall biosynthesis